MKISFKHGTSVVALALLATAGTAQAAEFITNGSFANPNVGGSYSANQNVPGWQNLAETYVEVGASTIYGLSSISVGGQNAEVNNSTLGDLVQTVSGLIVGQTYVFSFAYGSRSGGGAQELDTTLQGLTFTNTSDGSNTAWTLESGSFVATATSATLEFKSVDLGGNKAYGNEITNVSLTGPVPEPGTWTMMLAGFGLIGLGLRRRAKSAVSVTYG